MKTFLANAFAVVRLTAIQGGQLADYRSIHGFKSSFVFVPVRLNVLGVYAGTWVDTLPSFFSPSLLLSPYTLSVLS